MQHPYPSPLTPIPLIIHASLFLFYFAVAGGGGGRRRLNDLSSIAQVNNFESPLKCSSEKIKIKTKAEFKIIKSYDDNLASSRSHSEHVASVVL